MTDMHRCTKYRRERKECEWQDGGPFREREIEDRYLCAECGRERVGQFRKLIGLEKEARSPTHHTVGLQMRGLAAKVEAASRTAEQIFAGPLIKRLGGIRAESELEQLAASAPIRLVYRRQNGHFRLHALRVLDRVALSEMARPGASASRAALLARARDAVARLAHPEAQSIRGILHQENSVKLNERVVTALAGLAQLVDSGEVMPLRAFSAKVLGNSKSFLSIRNQIERLVGSVERLGIRDWGGLVLMGGTGTVSLAKGEICIDPFRCIGCSSDDILSMRSIQIPTNGILLVENLTPFQTCIEQLSKDSSLLLLWAGGFPNRGVTRLLQTAAAMKARIRVWCDIDLGGVRIARLIHRITNGVAEPVLMEPGLLQMPPSGAQLSPDQKMNIRRDLESHPDSILTGTLRNLLERGEWFEQETLLHEIAGLIRT